MDPKCCERSLGGRTKDAGDDEGGGDGREASEINVRDRIGDK